MSETKQPAPYPLRMPAEMRDALKEAAKKNDRSLNTEIVSRLSETLLNDQGSENPYNIDVIQRDIENAMSKLRQRLVSLKDDDKGA